MPALVSCLEVHCSAVGCPEGPYPGYPPLGGGRGQDHFPPHLILVTRQIPGYVFSLRILVSSTSADQPHHHTDLEMGLIRGLFISSLFAPGAMPPDAGHGHGPDPFLGLPRRWAHSGPTLTATFVGLDVGGEGGDVLCGGLHQVPQSKPLFGPGLFQYSKTSKRTP